MQQYFNPRSPHGERPAHQSEDDDKPHISIHAPRMGSDSRCEAIPAICSAFQSTPPRMGSDKEHTIISEIITISIHAPRMGSDAVGGS